MLRMNTHLLHSAAGTPTSFNNNNNTEMSSACKVGSCSGRLGAAVQRAMAIRERTHSSSTAEDIRGIGGMRDVYISWVNHSPPNNNNGTDNTITASGKCWSCGRYCAELTVVHKEASLCGIGTQSMRYARFLLDKDGFNTAEDEDVGYFTFSPPMGVVSDGPQSPQICGKCRHVEGRSINTDTKKKKGFLKYVCRQLFRLGKKSSVKLEDLAMSD